MMPPSREKVIDALRIIRRAGEDGATLAQFGAHWPGQLKKGEPRKTLAGVGQLLSRLAADGWVDRSALGPHGRFTLTKAGERLLGEAKAVRR